MVATVIGKYLAGKITAGHTAAEIVGMIDPAQPKQVPPMGIPYTVQMAR